MVNASLNGTSYSTQAEMDVGELTLQVSSLTAPTTTPIQVNSDIAHNGNTRCFNTLTMDYTGNAAGANNQREAVTFGSGATVNSDITGGNYGGSSFIQLDTYDNTGTQHGCFFATPTETQIWGPVNISIGKGSYSQGYDNSGVTECAQLTLKGNNIIIDAGTPNAATGGYTGSTQINGVCQAEYLQALHFNVPTVNIGGGSSTYATTPLYVDVTNPTKVLVMYYGGQKFTMNFTAAGTWSNGPGLDYFNNDQSVMITHDYTLGEDPNKLNELT